MHTFAWFLAAASLFAPPYQKPDTIPALIACLRDPDVETRVYAGTALAALGPQSVDALIATLRDGDNYARAGAAYALGQLGNMAAPAKQQLLMTLKDEDRDVRRQVAYALSRLMIAESERPTMPLLPPEPVFPKDPSK